MDLKDKIKIFFFDIDFTSFDHVHFLVRPLTMYALSELKKKGYTICISTSRALEEMKDIDKKFVDIMDGVITIAGGLIFLGDKKFVNYIDQVSVEKLVKYFDDNDVIYRYALDDGRCYLNRTSDYINDLFYKCYHMIPEVKEYEDEALVQIMYYPQRDDERINQELNNNFPNLNIINLSFSNEISPGGVDKGNTIKKVCEHFGFNLDEAMAFGDSENDVTMMEQATFGVCMANGTLTCKEVADYICEAQDQDGIYHTLVKFGFIDEYQFDEGLFSDLKEGMNYHLKQIAKIKDASRLLAKVINNDGVIQMLGIGKCEQFCQEFFYRAGGLVPFNKLVYQGQSLDELLQKYKLSDNDAYLLVADDGDEKILLELAKKVKANNQVLIVITRKANNSLNELANVSLSLIDLNVPLRYTIDNTLAQMLVGETYNYLKKMGVKPLVFISNNKENAKEYNDELLKKYEGRIVL